MHLAILALRSSPFLPPCPGPEPDCGDRWLCLRVAGEGSRLPPNGYLTWHPQRVCNPCLSCPVLLNIQWLSTILCHPLAYFLCCFIHCETSTNFFLWGMSQPHIVIQDIMQDLIGELSQSQGKFSSHPGISVKAQFREKMVMLLRSVRLGSRCPPAAGHQLRSHKNPPETLAGGGGTHQLHQGAAKIALAMHVMKVTFMRAIMQDPGNRGNWRESTKE